MSTARKVLASLGSLLLVLAGAPAAHAADTVITVRSFDTGGQAFFPWLFGCDLMPATGTGPKALVEATSPAPLLGTRSWGFQPTQPGQFYGWGVHVSSVIQLDIFQIGVHGADAGSGIAQVLVTPVDTPPNMVWVGAASVGGIGNAWFRVDASDLTYGWTLYSVEPFMKTSQTAPPATIVDFVVAHGGTTSGYTAAIGFGCSGQPFHYDAFEFGAPGAVTTLDFETARTQLTAGPGATITADRRRPSRAPPRPIWTLSRRCSCRRDLMARRPGQPSTPSPPRGASSRPCR